MMRPIRERRRPCPRIAAALLALLALLVCGHGPAAEASSDAGAQRSSMYVTVRDGTRLALDILMPPGPPGSGQRPAILVVERYHRAWWTGERVATWHDRFPWSRALTDAGYALAVADARGCGASFGSRSAPFLPTDGTDAYDLIEWLAERPWCNGRVGMMGSSFSGTVQYLAVAERPPHLRAIVPAMAMFDLYDFARPGGIARDDFAFRWTRLVQGRDSDGSCARVDEDARTGFLQREAMYQHMANRSMYDLLLANEHRDSVDATLGSSPYGYANPADLIDRVAAAGVPILHLTGWLDMWTNDGLRWWSGVPGGIELVVGPWSHAGLPGDVALREHLRWFDRHLADGGDTGFPKTIRYHIHVDGDPDSWEETQVWPIRGTQPTRLWLCEDPSGTIRSRHDASLAEARPVEDRSAMRKVDRDLTSGRSSRWWDCAYGDFAARERSGWTYTGPVLRRDLRLTGHPEIRLSISTDGWDTDVVAFLSSVSPDGSSAYLSEGCLRASHRGGSGGAEGEPPGPVHGHRVRDILPVDGKPMVLRFALLPLSTVVPAGHRLRLTLGTCDRDNLQLLERGAERVRIHEGEAWVDLPSLGR